MYTMQLNHMKAIDTHLRYFSVLFGPDWIILNPQNFIHDIFLYSNCSLFWSRKCTTVPLLCIVLYIFMFFIFTFPENEKKLCIYGITYCATYFHFPYSYPQKEN